MKKELLALAASLAIATSLSASVHHPTSNHTDRTFSATKSGSVMLAREKEPNDKRRGRGKDDPKGHKFADQLAREAEPKDDRGHKRGRGKDDPKGHKFADQLARETQPLDKKGKGKDRQGHKLV